MIWFHVIAGLLSLTSGAVALFASKGSTLHRQSGLIFVFAMMAMALTGAWIAAVVEPYALNIAAGLLTFYLVATGLLTLRQPLDRARTMTVALMLVAMIVGASSIALAIMSMLGAEDIMPGISAPPMLVFGSASLAGALGDLRLLQGGQLQGTRRIARHLWRMCFAMLLATTAFFLGQSDVFPEPIRKLPLLSIPVLLVLVTMIYWMWRMRSRRRRPA